MKKVVLLSILFFVGIIGQASALEYTGFLAQLTVPSVKEITFINSPSHNAGGTTLSIMSNTSRIATIDFSVLCNYDNWHVVAYAPSANGLINGSHVIPLDIDAVSWNTTAPVTADYKALTTSEPATSNSVIVGNYIGSTPASAAPFTLYLRANETEFGKRRAGYYSVFINLKIPDTI